MLQQPRAMTIAGSDSGGGAGIQADLKTFAAFGVYGTSAITAVTAQNTREVTQVLEMPAQIICDQIDAIMVDIGTDVVKTGMLFSTQIIQAVLSKIEEHQLNLVVVDPVMIAKSGHRLLQPEAVDALKQLLPFATVVTPNIVEAEVLAGRSINTLGEVREAARVIHALGPKAVIVKGGHLSGNEVVDLLFDGQDFTQVVGERVRSDNTHGTGCTFAAAVAAGLSKGVVVQQALTDAKQYVSAGIRHSFYIGAGHGPLNHFYHWW